MPMRSLTANRIRCLQPRQQDGGEFHVSLEPFSCENLKHLWQGAIRVSRTRADISAGLPTGPQVLRKLGHLSCAVSSLCL